MTEKCMVSDCKERAAYSVFDGIWRIKCCEKHTHEFEMYAKDNPSIKFAKMVEA